MILGKKSILGFSTYGEHRNIEGYKTQNYGRYTRAVKVRFPFDTYIKRGSEYEYVRDGTWFTLAHLDPETALQKATNLPANTDENQSLYLLDYYVPRWVNEGDYTIEYQATAINIDGASATSVSLTEDEANLDVKHYIASRKLPVTVVGRLYGFRIIDIMDYPRWKNVFRNEDQSYKQMAYRAGDKNLDGENLYSDENRDKNQYKTLPLLTGKHPESMTAGPLKTGYGFKFMINSIGNYDTTKEAILIEPTFKYISKNGAIQNQDIELYYHQVVNDKKQYYIKVGSEYDQKIKRYFMLGDPSNNIAVAKMKETAELLGEVPNTFATKEISIGNTTKVILSRWLKLFIGQDEDWLDTESKNRAKSSKQVWIGKYYLPNDLYAKAKSSNSLAEIAKERNGLDGNEEFWLKDGYIAVNFNIYLVRGGLDNKILVYDGTKESNNYGVNMWSIEGYKTIQKDAKGNEFNLDYGDIIFYDLDKKASDDYRVGGSH